MAKIGVRKPFRFLPAIAWALLLDAIDYTLGLVTLVLSFIGVGVVLDVVVDMLQTGLALVVFEDGMVLLAGGWEALPIPGIDLVPSFTLFVLAKEYNVIK